MATYLRGETVPPASRKWLLYGYPVWGLVTELSGVLAVTQGSGVRFGIGVVEMAVGPILVVTGIRLARRPAPDPPRGSTGYDYEARRLFGRADVKRQESDTGPD